MEEKKEKPKPYKCEPCNKEYAHRSGLRDHKLVHHPKDIRKKKLTFIVTCEFCQKEFTSKASRNTHLSKFHANRPNKKSLKVVKGKPITLE